MSAAVYDRAIRLSALSAAIQRHAEHLARHSQHVRAMRCVAIADALHHEAGGDRISAQLALLEAAWLRRAEKKGVAYA
jgi:hypothetical protein